MKMTTDLQKDLINVELKKQLALYELGYVQLSQQLVSNFCQAVGKKTEDVIAMNIDLGEIMFKDEVPEQAQVSEVALPEPVETV